MDASSSSHSVTILLDDLKNGDSQAAQAIWLRYRDSLENSAKRKLPEHLRRVADEEDVVITAFASFLQGVKQGRYLKLDDRHDVCQVLKMLVDRKAIDLVRWQLAKRRGGGDLRGESALENSDSQLAGINAVADPGESPTFEAQFAEHLDNLLAKLDDEELVRIAKDKWDGFLTEEIAKRLDRSLRHVERALNLIRRIWTES